ncbi:MAG: DEAD/DEAH box helicase family protein [Saprospiraceae bacterium]|nr:DEAD/DEAH box helicase family protein [Saprospiraceae bacterium]
MKAEGASFKTSKDKKLGTKTKPKVSIGTLDPVVTPSKDANTEIVEGVAEFGEYHSLLAKDYIVHSKEIEYKSVDINTFKKDGYKVVYEKVVPDEEGFVRKDLLSKINKDDSNTVVINVATGSGKTRTVYEIIEEIIKR